MKRSVAIYLIGAYIFCVLLAATAVRKAFASKIPVYVFYLISAMVFVFFAWVWMLQPFSGMWSAVRQYSFGIFLTWFVFVLVVSIFVLVEALGRILLVPFNIAPEGKILPSRRRFVSVLALAVAAVPFSGMIYGMLRGKYNYRVLKYTLFFEDLPEAFNGYQITHISDIHSGSFDSKEKVQHGIHLINQQKSDAIFFTGDLVNTKASEMNGWEEVFAQLSAPDGVFSVLGNHDYGDYTSWASPQAKAKNLQDLKDTHKRMGFELLLNEATHIHRGQQRIAIVGVENWGKGFIQRGNLPQALQNTSEEDFKILLSHDPTHWEYKVLPEKGKLQLTLSGHTHGMQFGIEIPGWVKWSPAQWRYTYWAGIYHKKGKYLNVNRGFGYLAFPGRVGMPPEISVIELRRSTPQA